MPVFVTSTSVARRHGAYALERTPPAAIKATGTGRPCLVAQLPWGPMQKLTAPSGLKALYNTIAPAGFDRTGSGYLSAIRKAWPGDVLRFVRVLGSTAAKATAVVATSAPATIWTVEAKYEGTAGNSITVTSSAASDGVSGHIKLTVTMTGASGTTTDIIDNLPTASAPSTAPDLSKLLLVGKLTFGTGGTAVLGTATMSGGVDGTINSGAYVGTAGTGDKGIAQLEGDKGIRQFFTDDAGDSLRAAVNAGLVAHATRMTNRVAFINGDSGQSASDAQTDVASYRSTRVVYTDPWVYVLDDVTGAKTLVPSAPFAASVASQLSPSTAISWKAPEVIEMLQGINDLEAERGESAADNSDAGIATFIREENGGFSIEAGVVTIAPSDPTRARLTRTRMGDYIAESFINSTRSFIDAPNVPYNQGPLVAALDAFMSRLKKNQDSDPNHTPHVVDYAISNLSAVNTADEIAEGNYTIPLDVRTSSGIEHLFLSIRFGEGVTVQHAA